MNNSIQVMARDQLSQLEEKEVLRLLLTSFSAKFGTLHLKLDEQLDILVYLERKYSQQLPPVDYIAKKENKIVGLLTIAGTTNYPQKLAYPFELVKKYGFFTIAHYLLLLTALDYRSADKEQYIENIAVHEKCQKQGIAKELIEMAQANTKNGEKLTLLVSAKNTLAKRLYLKCGFSIVKRKRKPLLGFLVNEPNWLFMEWSR
ncbi:GNAT family N-acetyltransferase [Enterococcus rotai]|uniref:GNAT family N-acetyltransferase n=1 Tax=Enterococcus rotai TaxID=118060 RepID=UPI0032B540EE